MNRREHWQNSSFYRAWSSERRTGTHCHIGSRILVRLPLTLVHNAKNFSAISALLMAWGLVGSLALDRLEMTRTNRDDTHTQTVEKTQC
jgi:hypothetical protein